MGPKFKYCQCYWDDEDPHAILEPFEEEEDIFTTSIIKAVFT